MRRQGLLVAKKTIQRAFNGFLVKTARYKESACLSPLARLIGGEFSDKCLLHSGRLIGKVGQRLLDGGLICTASFQASTESSVAFGSPSGGAWSDRRLNRASFGKKLPCLEPDKGRFDLVFRVLLCELYPQLGFRKLRDL